MTCLEDIADVVVFVALFLTFLPIPVVFLTSPDGSQSVHIAPEAFSVASAEFADELDVWRNALPGALKGQLSTVSVRLDRLTLSN